MVPVEWVDKLPQHAHAAGPWNTLCAARQNHKLGGAATRELGLYNGKMTPN